MGIENQNQGVNQDGQVSPADQQFESFPQSQDAFQDSVQPIDEPIVQPDPNSRQEGVQKDPSDGQLKALIAEREKRQKAEQEREFFRQLALQQQSTQQQDAYDPDDIPTYDAVNHMLDEKVRRINQDIRSQQILQMELQAKSKYSDWEDVVVLAKDLAMQNEGLGEAIMRSSNPAETAYLLGKTHPQYAEKQNQRVTQQVADKINNNLNRPPTLSSMGGGAANREDGSHYLNMSKADLEAEIRRVKGY